MKYLLTLMFMVGCSCSVSTDKKLKEMVNTVDSNGCTTFDLTDYTKLSLIRKGEGPQVYITKVKALYTLCKGEKQ